MDPSARGLATTIEAAIRTRILAPGEAVPSVREMAASAGVSTATAAAALTTLRRRGLIVTRERRRSVVSIRPPLALVTVAILWRFKKIPEPAIVAVAAVIGLVVYPLVSHA